MKKAKRTKKAMRTHIVTLSLPEDADAILKKQRKMEKSKLVAMLLRKWDAEQATAPAATMSPEETEIRQALQDRLRLLEIYGKRIYDMEEVIRKGEEWINGEIAIIKDWQRCMEEKGIADEHGYFSIYAKYNSQQSSEELWGLWSDVKEKFEDEKEKAHELRLKTEAAQGMTLQEAIDKLEAYLKRQLDKKVEELKIEGEKIPIEDAHSITERQRINERINRIQAKFEAKEVSMKEITAALGLPYNVIYNKIAALLRGEGYRII